jgi:choice-of-anchor A domain-containing protein
MKAKKSQSTAGEQGTALLITLFLVMLVGILLPPVLQRAVFHHSNAFRESLYLSAFHVAEAGIEEGVWHLSYDKQKLWESWETSNGEMYFKPKSVFRDADFNQVGEYVVRIDQPIPLQTSVNIGPMGAVLPFPITSQSEPVITAVAGVPDIASIGSQVRVVRVNARARTIFSLGLFSDTDLEISGENILNSFDSRLGSYSTGSNAFNNIDVGANNNIYLSGMPLLDGDAAAGSSVVLTGEDAQITGEVEGGISRVDLPRFGDAVEAAKLQNDNADIPQAVKAEGKLVDGYDPNTGRLNVAAEAILSLPGGTKENPKIYYFSEAKLNGNSQIHLDGYAIIFTDGDLDFTGGTFINNAGNGSAEQLLIFSSGDMSTEIGLNGGAGFAGAVYAPDAEVTLTGGGHFFGAAVGGSVTLGGNGQFHYDEALGDTGTIAFFEVAEWVERAPTYPSES